MSKKVINMYPLNVSNDRSLLLGLGEGRMLSVTAVTVLSGAPSS